MSLATHSPLSSSSPDAVLHVSAGESKQDLSVSCLNCLPLAFDDNCRIQESGSGLLANSRNTVITGGIFVVSLSCGVYKQLIIIHILSTRTTSPPPILGKGI